MQLKPQAIFTTNLVLRRFLQGDEIALFYNYCGDVQSARYLVRLPHTTPEQTAKFLHKWCDTAWNIASNEFSWVIALKETNEPIGVFLVMIEDNRGQIHFGIDLKLWNQGLIPEAGQAVIQWFERQPFKLKSLWTVCETSHLRSIRVLEKLGFKQDKVLCEYLCFPSLGETLRDCYVYSRELTNVHI